MNKVKETRNSEENGDLEQKAFKEVASFLIHRLRNPLGGIKGFASLLKRDLEGQPDLQKLANMIVDGTNSLDLIMAAVLDYAEPLELRIEPVDLVVLVKESFDQQQIRWTASTDSLMIQADESQIRKALHYLSDFAVHSEKNGGFAGAHMEINDSEAIITFVDKETVIPPERIHKVFSPFFIAPCGGEEGALAQAKKIVGAHNGSMEIASSSDGTTITVKLPISRG